MDGKLKLLQNYTKMIIYCDTLIIYSTTKLLIYALEGNN